MNQLELEKDMVDGGRRRALAHLQNNEDNGRAYDNPYAQAVYRRYIQPMADALTMYIAEKKRGVRASAKALLRDHDPMVLAFITLRHLLGECNLEERTTFTKLAERVGRTVYGEALLTAFEEINPDLYYTLVHDFERRMTKSERHRITVFKMQAAQNGIALPFWSPQDVVSVGTLLMYLARELGIIKVDEVREGRKTVLLVELGPEVSGLVEQISGFVAGAMPLTMPCVEPPVPWTSPNSGGYHSEAMRRNAPCCVRGRPFVSEDTDVPPMILNALNRLQRDVWEVNEGILEVVDQVRDRFDVGEVLSQAEYPKPERPEWLTEDMTKEDMNPIQLAAFAAWRALVREWHTNNRIRGVKWGRFYEALRVARMLQGRPLYFVWQMDYRGRFYAMTRGVSPQGSDLQKALLRAHKGAEVATQEAKDWFLIAGANRFGFDKADLADRIQWVLDRHDMIVASALDPVTHRHWTEADCPFQFLAWAQEYAKMGACEARGVPFVTHLPLGQDGSCNGLQHFSAMLRDEVGGKATNLVPSNHQQDLYGLVATRLREVIADDPRDDDSGIGARWHLHPIARGMVKRSVMTLPYGSTRFSCSEFILKEYLRTASAPEFAREEYSAAAGWVSHRLWQAIGDVVVKAREAMEWLQGACDELTAMGISEVAWRSPSGFLVRQRYSKFETVRIQTRLIGSIRIKPTAAIATDEVDKRKHHNGIAPNFVHSCDAAHMHYLINAAEEAGLGHLAFIHDDYGALAPDVEKLHELIRSTFVTMYQTFDPLQDFADTFGIQSELPEKGSLDITEVKKSKYFFI